jgi:DNA repair exonuclease SbcCD nuclease subunit
MTGDDHFDEHSRFDECIRVHAWMVELARDAKIDLFLDGGDVYERASTAIEREAVGDWLTPMAEIAPSLFVRGNHDRPLDVFWLRRLRTKHPVTVEEGAAVHYISGAAIAAVAWPERAALLAAAGSIEGTENLVRDALEHVFRGLGAQLAQHGGPRIGLMHAMIDGSIASTNQPLLGLPINVSMADLALLQAHLGLVSHIHRAQRHDAFGAPWLYAGASHRTDQSQTEPKSVVLAEFDGQRLVKLEEIETPATPMAHLNAGWDAESGELKLEQHGNLAGHEIRIRYDVAPDQQEQARAKADELLRQLLDAGVKAIKLEPTVIAQTRARAPEVSAATSLPEKVEAHWRSIGFDPGARRDPMLLKIADVEQEARGNAA